MDANQSAPLVGQIPSGLFILTRGQVADGHGLLASWVQQAGFEPLSVSVAIRRDRQLLDDLAPGRVFALNQVPDGEKTLFSAFGKGVTPGPEAFSGVDAFDLDGGGVGLNAAKQVLQCEVLHQADWDGDHVLVIAQALGGQTIQGGVPWVHIRKNGTHY